MAAEQQYRQREQMDHGLLAHEPCRPPDFARVAASSLTLVGVAGWPRTATDEPAAGGPWPGRSLPPRKGKIAAVSRCVCVCLTWLPPTVPPQAPEPPAGDGARSSTWSRRLSPAVAVFFNLVQDVPQPLPAWPGHLPGFASCTPVPSLSPAPSLQSPLFPPLWCVFGREWAGMEGSRPSQKALQAIPATRSALCV